MSHRQDLREEFNISRESLRDYEILEMLLFFAIPRRDTRKIAKELLKKFGSLDGVINADGEQLLSIGGLGKKTAHLLQLLGEIFRRILLKDLKKKPLPKIDTIGKVRRYCKTRIGHLTHEEMLVLFTNGRMNLVAEEILAKGDCSEVKIYKNTLLMRLIQNGARGIILVHNHPSGNPKPSPADIKITKDLNELLTRLDIRLHDHIIVSGGDKFFSFAAAGMLD